MALEDEGKEASRGRGFCPVRRCRERRERLVPEGGPSQGYFGALNSLNRFWGCIIHTELRVVERRLRLADVGFVGADI